MSKIIEVWWKELVEIRDKFSWWSIINVPIQKYREIARWLIMWKKDLDHTICERKNWKRFTPTEVVRQKMYNWTAIIEWSYKEIEYTILDISKNWLQIGYIWKELNIWDKLELTFTLWKNYTLSWRVVWNKNNLYWIEITIPWENEKISVLANNYSRFISMIIKNTAY